MSTRTQVMDGIHDELVGIITAELSLTDPSEHVGILNTEDNLRLPYFGYESFPNRITEGFGGDGRVANVNHDANGNVESFDIASRKSIKVDVGVVVDEDVRVRNQLFDAVEQRFDAYSKERDPTTIATDVCEAEVDSVPESTGNTDFKSNRITLYVEYKQFRNFSDFAPMKNINVAIEASGATVPQGNTTF